MLTSRELKCLQLRKTMTLKQIGEQLENIHTGKLGTKHERPRQLIEKGLRKLRSKYIYCIKDSFEMSVNFFKYLQNNRIEYIYDKDTDRVKYPNEIRPIIRKNNDS